MQTDETNTCYKCETEKPLSEFTQRIDDMYYNMCRSCVSEILTLKGKSKKRLKHTDTHRTCYLCLKFLSVDRFTRRATGSYYSACKDCNLNVFAQRRRARKQAAEGSFNTEEWELLLSQTPRCPRCDRLWDEIPKPANGRAVIHRDHIIPLAKGGNNYIENIQPLCYSCNSKKGDRIEED